ncbi:MAG: sigma 54-interacting transcriptional regulator [Bacteroidia bacterium]|nr:sigma 54-interacting transcriptional regulator [Bacteroidia bacterium]
MKAPAGPGRVIVSWIAWHYDYVGKTSSEIETEGPTFELHRQWYKPELHREHVLVSPKEDGDLRSLELYTALVRAFPGHSINLVFKPLRNIFDFQEIKQRAEEVLELVREDDIDILASNGTTPMRMVWMALHLEDNGFRTRLIQGADRAMAEDGPKIFEVKVTGALFNYRIQLLREPGETPDRCIPQTLKPVYGLARRIAEFDALSCLIEGESGTGKELIAREIHQFSHRRGKPFVAINCGAFRNDDLLESRLFGHRKGAFTGAAEHAEGYFGRADGGILFLDEIGDISMAMQSTLLRALQEQRITPVGGTEERPVDVRMLAATNKDLEAECRAGRFRWDLYYRLVRTRIRVPPLRAYSVEDRRELVGFLMDKCMRELRLPQRSLSRETMDWLMQHDFPGNIREMENLIFNASVLSDLYAKELSLSVPAGLYGAAQPDLSLEGVKRRHIQRTLEYCGGNKAQAARLLEISLNTLKKYLGEADGD